MYNSQSHEQHYHTSIAYLASQDSSAILGIIIYFLRRKYLADKAAKRLRMHTGFCCFFSVSFPYDRVLHWFHVRSPPPPGLEELRSLPPPGLEELRSLPPPGLEELRLRPPPALEELRSLRPPALEELRSLRPPGLVELRSLPLPGLEDEPLSVTGTRSDRPRLVNSLCHLFPKLLIRNA